MCTQRSGLGALARRSMLGGAALRLDATMRMPLASWADQLMAVQAPCMRTKQEASKGPSATNTNEPAGSISFAQSAPHAMRSTALQAPTLPSRGRARRLLIQTRLLPAQFERLSAVRHWFCTRTQTVNTNLNGWRTPKRHQQCWRSGALHNNISPSSCSWRVSCWISCRSSCCISRRSCWSCWRCSRALSSSHCRISSPSSPAHPANLQGG